jgi:predicted metal-dependent hydrolase
MNHGKSGETALERGIRLFNEGQFFHAHEAWEDWWRETTPPEKRASQGMVQVAVAMHHSSRGNWEGARSVMKRALGNLEAAPDDFRGLDLSKLRADIRLVIQQLGSNQAITVFQIVRK